MPNSAWTEHRASAAPPVTAGIPCRNERGQISRCLESIFAQDEVPGGVVVIAAGGVWDDGTRAILDEFAGREQRLRVIDSPGRITACAFNAAIRAARGRYVALL